MISNMVVANALEWWEPNSGIVGASVPEWRKARNHWLRAQGVSGIIKDGKRSKSIPSWWTDGTEFWFADSIDEQIFLNRWSKQ